MLRCSSGRVCLQVLPITPKKEEEEKLRINEDRTRKRKIKKNKALDNTRDNAAGPVMSGANNKVGNAVFQTIPAKHTCVGYLRLSLNNQQPKSTSAGFNGDTT